MKYIKTPAHALPENSTLAELLKEDREVRASEREIIHAVVSAIIIIGFILAVSQIVSPMPLL